MGIPGLLPALKDFTKTDAHIRDWKGKAIAVDTSCWLHKAVYSVADVHVQATEAGKVNPHAVRVASRYLLQRCRELITHAGIAKLYLVLDGQHRCPLKAVTHQERARRRAKALEQARQAPTKQAAYDKYKACISIPHAFTLAVLQQVKQDPLFRQSRSIVVVQAPHEADAQLIHLQTSGHVQAIITEDSDVLVYAVSARSDVTVLYKFNHHTGACQAISMEWLWSSSSSTTDGSNNNSVVSEPANSKKGKGVQQQVWRTLQTRERVNEGFGRRLFVQACVLTGCDYAPNTLPGVGLVKAFQLLIMDHTAFLPADHRFSSVVRGRLTPRSGTTAYVNMLRQAEAVFYYHPVRRLNGSLSWLTGGLRQPCAPPFPDDNLAILGDPAELKHLTLPVEANMSLNTDEATRIVTQESQASSDSWDSKRTHLDIDQPFDSYLNQSSTAAPTVTSLPKMSDTNDSTMALDGSLLEIIKPATVPVKPIAAAKKKPILSNPYRRKRPLVNASNPQPTSLGTFNPFARFCRVPEKENDSQGRIQPSQSTNSNLPKDRGTLPATESKKDDLDKDDSSATDGTDVSSIASPVSDVSTSPFFASRNGSRKVPEDSLKFASTKYADETGTVFSAVPPQVNSSKPVAVSDFYDEWLSPKKRKAEDEVVDIEDDSPPTASRQLPRPIPPQGVLRFRLGGLMTTKRTVTSKSNTSTKNSLSTKKIGSQQRKLVYRPPRSTLFDHFRASKNSSER